MWPRMNAGGVVVTDEATRRYDCLAWTLGIMTSWIWPWGSKNAAKADFDAFYHSYGFSHERGHQSRSGSVELRQS